MTDSLFMDAQYFQQQQKYGSFKQNMETRKCFVGYCLMFFWCVSFGGTSVYSNISFIANQKPNTGEQF